VSAHLVWRPEPGERRAGARSREGQRRPSPVKRALIFRSANAPRLAMRGGWTREMRSSGSHIVPEPVEPPLPAVSAQAGTATGITAGRGGGARSSNRSHRVPPQNTAAGLNARGRLLADEGNVDGVPAVGHQIQSLLKALQRQLVGDDAVERSPASSSMPIAAGRRCGPSPDRDVADAGGECAVRALIGAPGPWWGTWSGRWWRPSWRSD
jgi:hypothetical protein